MADETLSIGLELKIDQLRDEFAKVPGIGRKEARAMVRDVTREYKKAEKAATKLRKANERAFGASADKAKDTAERVASLFGGAFGDVSDSVLDLGARIGELGGSLGGAAGAMTLATGGAAALALGAGFAAQAFFGWMDTAEDLRASLEDVTGVDPLSDEHAAALDAYAAAGKAADVVMTQHTLQLQAEFAPAATEAKLAVVGLVDALSDLAGGEGALAGYYETFQSWMELNPVVWAYNEAIEVAAERGQDVVDSVDAMGEAFRATRKEIADAANNTVEDYEAMAEALGLPTRAVADLTNEYRKWGKEAREAARAEAKQAEELEKLWENAARKAAQDGAARIKQAEKDAETQEKRLEKWDEEIEKLQEAGDAWRDLSEDAVAYAEALEEQVLEKQREAIGELTDASLNLVTDISQLKIEALQREAAEQDKVRDRELRRLSSERARIKEQMASGKISEKAGKDRLQQIDDEEKAAKQAARSRKREMRQALKAAHAAQQAAAIARATIDAAANAVALTGSLSYLGVGAPAAAVGIAAAQLATQIAAITAVEPPSFARGGLGRDRMSGDHRTAFLEPEEGVLTRRGVRAAGGRQGIDALNRGRGLSQGGNTQVYLDGKMLGEVVARVIRSDKAVADALASQSGKFPGIRRG